MHLDLQKSLRELIILFAILHILTNFALVQKFREPNVFTVQCKQFEFQQHENHVLECTFITKAV